MNIIWTYGYSDRPFWSSGNKKCFENNIDATTIECDIDQESREKFNRREKLTFDGYILLKNYVGWSLEINT